MITLEQLGVQAGTFHLADVSFTIPTGSYAALMGRTGCGKTTLLEAICGLRRVTHGRIRLHQHDVTDWPPGQRGIGFVPQEAALFHHLSVRQHLEFAPVIHRWNRPRIEARVRELADWLHLDHLLDRGVLGLSGGESQRVALGRALAAHPDFLCLDEPLSALDDETREDVCTVLQDIHRRTGITVLHITHNRLEAARLATLFLRLDQGRIVASPHAAPAS